MFVFVFQPAVHIHFVFVKGCFMVIFTSMSPFLSGHNKRRLQRSACVACVLCHLVANLGTASSHDAFHFCPPVVDFSPVSPDIAGICVMVQLNCLEEESISAPLGPQSLKVQRSGQVEGTYRDAELPKLLLFTERSQNKATASCLIILTQCYIQLM